MNRTIKLLMINPTADRWRVGVGKSPRKKTRIFRYSMLSSLCVAAAMPPFVETELVDEEIMPIDFDSDADIVGVSFMTFNAPRAYEIADIFRRKGKTLIAGGYHPTFMPEEALKHFDAVCVGEAEGNVPAMIEDYMAGHLQPIYRNGTLSLAGLPVLNRTLIRRHMYSIVDTVQATRGCPYQCRFCSITSFFNHSFRMRPVDEVIDELRTLGTYILFMDDNITTNPEYARELFARMIPLKKRWFSQCSTRIGYDDELLKLAKASGCKGLFIGFESLSDESLNGWRKSFNKTKDYMQIVKKIHSHGIGICGAIVFGHDCETKDIFPVTLEFLLEGNIDALQATILTPFPGTPLYDEYEKEGRIFDRDWSHYDFCHTVFEPSKMSCEELKRGHDWVLRNFYSLKSVSTRLVRQTRYLNPSTMFRATIPLNIGYRARLMSDGTFSGSS